VAVQGDTTMKCTTLTVFYEQNRQGGGATAKPAVSTQAAAATGPVALFVPLEGELDGYHLFHAARADLFRRLERNEDAAAAYRRALELVTNPRQRAYLEGRLAEVTAP
jgi:RNA polymerase sigma-70 factor (ECF subfamily)